MILWRHEQFFFSGNAVSMLGIFAGSSKRQLVESIVSAMVRHPRGTYKLGATRTSWNLKTTMLLTYILYVFFCTCFNLQHSTHIYNISSSYSYISILQRF